VPPLLSSCPPPSALRHPLALHMHSPQRRSTDNSTTAQRTKDARSKTQMLQPLTCISDMNHFCVAWEFPQSLASPEKQRAVGKQQQGDRQKGEGGRGERRNTHGPAGQGSCSHLSVDRLLERRPLPSRAKPTGRARKGRERLTSPRWARVHALPICRQRLSLRYSSYPHIPANTYRRPRRC
jgi:hypothetical protein